MSIQTARELNLIIGRKMGYLPKKVIYVGASEPSNKSEGKLWYDKTNNKLLSSDGTSYLGVNIEENLNPLIQEIIRNKLNLLELNSGASVNFTHEGSILEVFSDSNGMNNTINTGNTTAKFDSEKYKNLISGSNTISTQFDDGAGYENEAGIFKSPTGLGWSGSVGSSSHDGAGSRTGENHTPNIVYGNYVWGIRAHEGTTAYLYIPANEGAWSGNYCLRNDNDGSWITCTIQYLNSSDGVISSDSFARTNSSWASFSKTAPAGTAKIKFIINNTSSGGYGGNLEFDNISYTSGTEERGNGIIELNQQTIPANPTSIFVYADNTLLGSGDINFDYKIGSGEWHTSQELLTEIANIDEGTTLDFKLNLKGVGSGNEAEAENLAILLFYD